MARVPLNSFFILSTAEVLLVEGTEEGARDKVKYYFARADFKFSSILKFFLNIVLIEHLIIVTYYNTIMSINFFTYLLK